MEHLLSLENGIALLTLALLEIVLGIDNLVFLSIMTSRLPEERRHAARRLGLVLAMLMRIALLFAISWVMRLTEPLFRVAEVHVSGRDLILVAGGLFLLAKATFEIHANLEGQAEHHARRPTPARLLPVLIQLTLLDVVFSLDSVITAVGMAKEIGVMIAAIVVAVGVMMVFADSVSRFIERHPTLKMLALAFLVLIGVMLIAEGTHHHVDKRYIYFAMAFSLGVEFLNMRRRGRTEKPPAAEQAASEAGGADV